MAVFLRWLLADFIVIRLLRRHRLRRYADRSYAVVSQQQYPGPSGRVHARHVPTYHYVRRRRRMSCCSGCLILVAAIALGAILLAALGHWLF
ncbi:MAG: hypothetical protein WAW53_15010 [Candidatus Dormiibacterota bacterium]